MRNGMTLRRVAPPWPMLFNSNQHLKMADLLDAKAIAAADPERQKHGQIGAIMRHARPHRPDEDHLCRNAHRWRARAPDLLLGL
jgi:hypothetical protein